MGLARSSGTGATTMGDLPNSLEVELNLLGVRTNPNITIAVDANKTKTEVERDYTFKMPTLDENGDPPW